MFGKTGSELSYLFPSDGSFSHRQIIDGVIYVDLSSFWNTLWYYSGVEMDVDRNLDEKMIIIDLPEGGFLSK